MQVETIVNNEIHIHSDFKEMLHTGNVFYLSSQSLYHHLPYL